MSKHKYTSLICLCVFVFMILITILFTAGEALGITPASKNLPYVQKLFSTDKVHTLDIEVDENEWRNMLDNASAKEYILCNVVINGELIKSVGIRPKGNSSLSSMLNSESDRYSFKMEFDHFVSGKTYYGLDKLALNNIFQDSTYMKDYLSYQLMSHFDAYGPLSSFIYITVNGKDWGLYLAVEGIEEAFAQRTFGNDYGQIYKPEFMSGNMGGARNRNAEGVENIDNIVIRNIDNVNEVNRQAMQQGQQGQQGQQIAFVGGMMGGSSSSDVALVYSDDEHDSYSNIFNNATFDITNADKDRLIASIKQLNEGVNLEEVVNIEEVLRYFTVHNFVLNFDSYTGSMTHNYYLHENSGVMSMIAWDYNLGFGSFSMGGGNMRGGGSDSATAAVNYPIDTPLSGPSMEDRPMIGQLFANEQHFARYHELFSEFIETTFDTDYFIEMFDNAIALISPYVEKDPTALCTYEEFLLGSSTLREFCLLRAESIRGQLDGIIPSTSEGQSRDSSALIDASHLDFASMGSMGGFRMRDNTEMPTELFRNDNMQNLMANEAIRTNFNSTDNTTPPSQPPVNNTMQLTPPTGETPPIGRDFQTGETPPVTETPLTMEMPPDGNNMQGNFFPQNNMARGVQQGQGSSNYTSSNTNNNDKYYLLGAAIVILMGGLIFAKKFS